MRPAALIERCLIYVLYAEDRWPEGVCSTPSNVSPQELLDIHDTFLR